MGWRRGLVIGALVVAAPWLMAPSCGTPPPMDCSTVENHYGAHAFQADGTLVVLSADDEGATWQRFAPPWTAPPAALVRLAGVSYPRYLPRLAPSPSGARVLVRGPIGAFDDQLIDLDGNGPQVVPVGAANGDHLDFAAAFDGDTPYVLAGRYGLDATVTLQFLRGPTSPGGGAWTTLGALSFTGPPPPTGSGDLPVQGQPLALVREAGGDLVGYELTAGLLVVSGGTLSRPALTLPHPSVVAAAAALSPAGEAVVFLLAEDGNALRLDRVTHTGGVWGVDSVSVSASWVGLRLDRIDSQLVPIDDAHLAVLIADIGDDSYALYWLTRDVGGTWSWEVPCSDVHCDNTIQQRGYTRLQAAPGPLLAVNAGGVATVLSRTGGSWTTTATGPENQIIPHLCETCSVAVPSPHAHVPWWPVWLVAAAGWVLRLRRVRLVVRRDGHEAAPALRAGNGEAVGVDVRLGPLVERR